MVTMMVQVGRRGFRWVPPGTVPANASYASSRQRLPVHEATAENLPQGCCGYRCTVFAQTFKSNVHRASELIFYQENCFFAIKCGYRVAQLL